MPRAIDQYKDATGRRGDWRTPPALFAKLDAEFGFTLDAAASEDHHFCERYFTAESDGLSQSWAGEVVFVNPPYGKHIPHWVAKAWQEVSGGATVVMLLPAYADVRWWHDYVTRAAEVRCYRGRIHFVHPENGREAGCPHASVIVVWRPGYAGPPVLTSYNPRPTQEALL